MAEPWDPFPLPTHADHNDRITYEGVGRVLTMWEHVEFALSRVYSILLERQIPRFSKSTEKVRFL